MELEDRTYSFYCNNLNIGKYDILHKKAINLRDFRNRISVIVCSNPLYYIDKGKYDWITLFRETIEYCNNQDINRAIQDVYVNYDNKREAFKRKTNIQIQDKIVSEYYKINTKAHNRGDLKSFEVKMKSTPLTKVVTYLVKYYNQTLIEYLKNDGTKKPELIKFHKTILGYIEKYGDRLLDVVKHKQQNIINDIFGHPIEFASLTFTSCTEQIQNIINRNPNTTSIYNAFITLPGQPTEDGKIHIPVKHSKKHHGSLKYYYKKPNKKGQRCTTYKIYFEKDQIRIILTRKKKTHTVINKTSYYGIDVNVKHNLFCDKEGRTIDYDREIFEDYIKFIKELDAKINRKKDRGLSTKLSNKDIAKKKDWMIRIKDMEKRKTSDLVKQTISLGKDHLVLEDLGQMGKMFSRSDEFEGFKYSRIIKLLSLADLKNIAFSIANKKGIQCTFVQAPYTSQLCDDCGNISKLNRKIQEIFKCTCCGKTKNADAHSASNIEDRLRIDVLRNLLLNCTNGVYTPKRIKREKLKQILSECYDVNTSVIE